MGIVSANVDIIIENQQDKLEYTNALDSLIKDAIIKSLENEGFDTPSEISVTIVDNEQIRNINKDHRGIDKATDVLSFPMLDMIDGTLEADEGDYDMDENKLILGDIVVSLEKAKEQADDYGHSLEREIAFLVTHGIFHLLGYDHENKDDEEIMIGKQEKVLISMGLGR